MADVCTVTPRVVLVPLSPDEQQAFISELAAEDAAWRVERGDASDPAEALARARAEIEGELEAAAQDGDQLWAAQTSRGETVGWLWVKYRQAGLPPDAAFLEQILVRPAHRRRGHAAAMLVALEVVLAARGRRELHLNVWNTNTPGRRLYARAGYETIEQLPGKCHLRKPLLRS